MSEPFDVIAVGETMLSLVAADGTLASATGFHATHGGAESNACIEMTRRGLRTSWVSRLGDDPPGRRIRSWLADAGVDLTWVATDPARPTGLMLRDGAGDVRYWRTGSAASAMGPEDLADVPIETARAVLVTGITAMIGTEPGRTAVSLLERARGSRAVDINLRRGLWGSARARELIMQLLTRCDVLFGGEDELRVFAPGRGEDLARGAARLGPREVVVKTGATGAAALTPEGRWVEHRPAPVADVDPVGAGDAFDGAYLAARLAGRDVEDALADGAGAGALVAARMGDTGTA